MSLEKNEIIEVQNAFIKKGYMFSQHCVKGEWDKGTQEAWVRYAMKHNVPPGQANYAPLTLAGIPGDLLEGLPAVKSAEPVEIHNEQIAPAIDPEGAVAQEGANEDGGPYHHEEGSPE